MDIIMIYTIFFSTFIISIIGSQRFYSYLIRQYEVLCFLKRALYRPFSRLLWESAEQISWMQMIALVIYISGNIIALCAGISSPKEFSKRSGLLSTVNLVPLYAGSQMNAIIDFFEVSLSLYAQLHRWLARMVILGVIVHVVASMISQRPDIKSATDIAGIISALCLFSILLTAILRRYMYEVSQCLHVLLGSILLIALFFHSPTRFANPPAAYLVTAGSLGVASGLLVAVRAAWQNVRYKRPLSQASVQIVAYHRQGKPDIPLSDAVHVHIRLSVPWQEKAGEYVYIWMPGLSRTSIAQLHPYYIAWRYQKDNEHYATIVVQRQRGFSNDLFSIRSNSMERPLQTLILDGPYGKNLRLELYGSILLIATGFGIAGQLPYATQVLDKYRRCSTHTRKLVLLWQIQTEDQMALVADRLTRLIKEDNSRVLQIHIFVIGGFLSDHTRIGDHKQISESLDMRFGPMDIEKVLESEWSKRKGKLAILASTEQRIYNKIEAFVGDLKSNEVFLEKLEFSSQ